MFLNLQPTRVGKEGQEKFHDKSQYPSFLQFLSKKHGLDRKCLQKLTLPWQAETDDERLTVFFIACLDILQRVSAQLQLLSAIQLNILKSFRPKITTLYPFSSIEPLSLIRYSRVFSTWREHTHRGDIHTEGTYTQRGHTHRGDIHTRGTYTPKRLTHGRDLQIRGHTHGGDIHIRQRTYTRRQQYTYHTERTYTRRGHTHGGGIYTEGIYT